MEVVLLCLSLLVQHGLAQEPCKCLDQILCGDSSECGYRCREGFAGKYCSQVNLGFNISLDAPEIFDGDFSTCGNYGERGTKITFKHSIDIDKIRIHRKNNETGTFYAYLHKSSKTVSSWNLDQYKLSIEGAAIVASFIPQTGVTAIKINSLGTELELTNARFATSSPPKETSTTNEALVCNDDACNQHGTCENVNNRAVCRCHRGYTGDKCNTECPAGHYGQDCLQECSEGCKDTCNHVDGTCACNPGWKRRDCSKVFLQCSPGCAGVCDSNGRCDTCKPGWMHSDANNPLCDKKCAPGHYGAGCQQSCSSGCSGFTCNHVTGRCSCKDGWTGEKCNQCTDGYSGINCRKCSEGCADICNKANGDCNCKAGWTGTDCSRECRPGHYGLRCQQTCSSGCLRTCDHVTGNCPCIAGWTGELCDECEDGHYGQDCLECSEGCGNICNLINGYCTCKAGWTGADCSQECSAGWYGQNCKTRCYEGCQTEHCNHVTGRCNSHCRDGWTGGRCKKKCGPGRYGPQCRLYCRRQCVNCDHVSGSCGHNCTSGWFGEKCTQNCPAGKYGQQCESKCNEGCDPHKCDPATGDCTGHCKEGWTGHNCKHECPRGSYGLNCSSSCSPGCENGLCEPVEGKCYDETCNAGWKHLNDSLKRCDEKCAPGMYGENCALNCSKGCVNGTCDPVTGVCAKCIQGWELNPAKSTSCVLATTPAIHTGPTAPSTGTQERNDLDCSGGRMRIHVPQTLLPTHIVTLRDPSCKVASNGSHLLADVGVNECGTTVSFTNDSVIFTNELVATALSGTTAPTIIDYGMNMKDQRVKISCIYPRENRVDFSYVPVMKEAHFYERQYGKLSFDVSQYSDEQFSHVIPHNGLPIGVTLNTELFIDISLRHASHKGVGIMVDSCIATPTSSPADPLWYTVIKDGCPAQQDVRTFASPDVDEFRFSFLVFRFTQAPLQKAGPNLPPTSMVFIHCQVSACPSQNCTNNCNPAGSHRVRREAELENSHLVSAGPFYLKSEEERGGYTGGVVAASVSVAVVATLVAIVALVAWRRSVNKLSKHQTLDEAS